ncbi:baseplate J/gp47 family protein [Paenibacillus graminis]|uniref:baseplate J/gp47 family protein n=2 Tax=Paenibacillus graminis TaxID=189425 RepID=UPI002DB5966E|nr:baseplate J/gp47 family protein [Paenibacillus graminis]MEC0171424.1 baseplate J/gp47 family protein [Paenibacillus graminis]
MYENQTFETILQRMLDRVPADIDKREGSIIYDAMAPAALELAQMYVELDINANLMFADTASGDYLDKAVSWSGVTRKAATKAQMHGLFYNDGNALMDIPIGSRFALGEINYKATERLSLGEYRMEAETAGAAANANLGTLLPIDYVNNLARAELAGLLIAGTNRESDSALYERYQDRISKPITSGNRYQYEEWARETSGVGRAKAFPLWDGPGTVKVVLVDNAMRAPSAAIVQAVQTYIDPSKDGMGNGAAPIGAVVTVVPATEVPINIAVKVTLASGATTAQVQTQLAAAAESYLAGLAFVDPLVRYTRIQGLILDIPPVIDYENLTVNGATSNVEVADDAVAVLGTVTVT